MAFTGLGAGTVGDPYQITTKAQFQEIATNLNMYLIQMNDIDLSELDCSSYGAFTGNFNGQNFKILNVVALFKITGGTFKNSRITKINVTTRAVVFQALSGATMADVSINIKSSGSSVAFADSISASSVITNVTMLAAIPASITYGTFSSSTLNNCIFQSSQALTFGRTLNVTTTSVIFNDCKFISRNKVWNGNKDLQISGCTFNHCLMYGSWYLQSANALVNEFSDSSIIQDIEWTRTGSLTDLRRILWENGFKANFTRCYFGGQMNIRHQSFTEGTGLSYKLGYPAGGGLLTDCHFGFNFNPTFDITSVNTQHGILPDSYFQTPVRLFCDAQVSPQLNRAGLAVKNGTNCFINSDKIESGVTLTANYGLLTTAQTKAATNFTNFDFTNVWQITEGVSAPKLRNTIYSHEPYLLDFFSSVSVIRQDETHELLSININQPYSIGIVSVYVSTSLLGIEDPTNLVPVSVISDSLLQASLTVSEGIFNVLVKYVNGIIKDDCSISDFHYLKEQVSTTAINIVSPNYVNFTNPRMSYLHGTCFYNGYIYGSARGLWDGTDFGFMLVKLKADDYSVVQIVKLYSAKTSQISPFDRLDQIVFCNGFLWAQSRNTIIRINPDDLDYMYWKGFEIPSADNFQPIGTDGRFLFVSGDSDVAKFDTNFLIGSFASYGFNGTNTPLPPTGSCVGICSINQVHPTLKGYVHSIISDSSYIYIACTTCATINGYSNGTYVLFLQKINKSTMLSEGTVTIPKCTDDMVQNAEWLFLAPEYENITPDIFGSEYGLIAVRKSNLELKFLKALHKEFNTVNEVDRAAYGVQYFAGKIIVQLIASRKSVVINAASVENWGANFPIGGATEAIYNFQKDGIDLPLPPNELVIDSNNWVHISDWGAATDILKFPLDQILPEIPIVYNAVSLHNDDTIALLEFIDSHFGCSIRCVQDAPGIATGVTGTVTDQDGNTYDTVVINEKRWMVQNLKTKKYQNGDAIPEVSASGAWQGLSSGGYCNVI